VEIPLVALQLAQQEVYRDKGSERKKHFLTTIVHTKYYLQCFICF